MDLQSLVTDNLLEDDEGQISLWEEQGQDYIPQEALALGQQSLRLLSDGNWRKPAARFAVRLLHHKVVLQESLGVQIMVRILSYDEDPSTLPELEALLESCVRRVQLEVRTSSAEEAFAYLEELWGDDAARVIGLASGTREVTVNKWIAGQSPAKTRLQKIYALVRICDATVPLLGEERAKKWIEEPLPDWNKSPIELASRERYGAPIPYEVRLAIRDLQSAHSQ